MMIGPGARRLKTTRHEKIWGTTNLSPIFPEADTKIGEVWFEDEERLPLLFKFLFTSERLSIQSHPDDDYGKQHHDSLGKTEMWHILRADPGGEIGLGFNQQYTAEEVEAGARSGKIESMLTWRKVEAGENYFVPAGEVHAIGAGVAICEIQQNSDITYRLYDYGRPRELHLEHGMAVSKTRPYDGLKTGVIECPYFRTERMRINSALSLSGPRAVVMILEGKGKIAGEPYEKGEGWRLLRNLTMEPSTATTLLYVTWPE
jgi:mannose-6-phosphate isomerase